MESWTASLRGGASALTLPLLAGQAFSALATQGSRAMQRVFKLDSKPVALGWEDESPLWPSLR